MGSDLGLAGEDARRGPKPSTEFEVPLRGPMVVSAHRMPHEMIE